ncbi:MAG: hypothetical protein NC082_00385, partial [Clostridiales bacterium]|nr:hypothetical protein [Clostridiales bacterium]
MERKLWNMIVIVILFLLIAVSLGMSLALHRNTLIEWWKPAVPLGVLACVAGVMLVKPMGRITAIGNRLANYSIGVVVVMSLLSGLFFTAQAVIPVHMLKR